MNRTVSVAALSTVFFASGVFAMGMFAGTPQAFAEEPDLPLPPSNLGPLPIEQAASATTWGIAGYNQGRGVGARMTLPAADGLFPRAVADVFAIDIGADYLLFHEDAPFDAVGGTSGSILRPVAGVLWAFRLSNRLALYPKVEVGWNVPRSSAREPEVAVRQAGMHIEGIAGLLLSLGRLSLRAESGWGYLKAGVGFAI